MQNTNFIILTMSMVVLVANISLLVLQLVLSRLLTPLLGSSLETWTIIIASFLLGISLGNAWGGRWADRVRHRRMLPGVMFAALLATIWLQQLPVLAQFVEVSRWVPITARIPLLGFLAAFPVAFVLSVLTPLAIRWSVSSIAAVGRISGMMFALGTLGSLIGNYATGFLLIPNFYLDTIIYGILATLAGLTVLTFLVLGRTDSQNPVQVQTPKLDASEVISVPEVPPVPMGIGIFTVFVCSFSGMTLELTGVRLLAPMIGVSLYTWTGVIGVMLAGTMLGNALGGLLADRLYRRSSQRIPRTFLGLSLLAASLSTILILLIFAVLSRQASLDQIPYVQRVLVWTFSMLFLPMFFLGLITPQMIRLVVPEIQEAGRTAGKLYAWSTAGALAGTFLTGYVLLSQLGMLQTVFIVSLLPLLALLVTVPILKNSLLLYGTSSAVGCILAGFVLLNNIQLDVVAESNYYTIQINVQETYECDLGEQAVVGFAACKPQKVHRLFLDSLMHSQLKLQDPRYLYYTHEQIQFDCFRRQYYEQKDQHRLLVIGGGGYTLPRCITVDYPRADIDVVEIDPGVTDVAYDHLGLDRAWPLNIFHMDGRQYISDVARDKKYHLITLDAVNDFSVPWHLLTREFNQKIQTRLEDKGIYLVSVIDEFAQGQLWWSVVKTLQADFPYVQVLVPQETLEYLEMGESLDRTVLIIYASNQPWDGQQAERIIGPAESAARLKTRPVITRTLTEPLLQKFPPQKPPHIFIDQFAPVDQLMLDVYKRRVAGE